MLLSNAAVIRSGDQQPQRTRNESIKMMIQISARHCHIAKVRFNPHDKNKKKEQNENKKRKKRKK